MALDCSQSVNKEIIIVSKRYLCFLYLELFRLGYLTILLAFYLGHLSSIVIENIILSQLPFSLPTLCSRYIYNN